MTERVRSFADELRQFELPVELQDERHTSREAEERLKSERARGIRGRVSKEAVDREAAVLIAERWLVENSR